MGTIYAMNDLVFWEELMSSVWVAAVGVAFWRWSICGDGSKSWVGGVLKVGRR